MKTILRSSDQISFVVPPPLIIPAIAAPVPLTGTALAWVINGQAVCVEGDELPQSLLPPQTYTSPPFTIPGTGTLSVTLTPAHLSVIHKHQGKSVLLKGSTFTAKFQVASPAQQPTPAGPVPDPVAVKTLTASFITTNLIYTAS